MILWTKHHYYYYYCYYYVSIIFILFYFFKNRTTGSNDTNVSTKVNYPTVLQKSLVFLISRFCFTSRLSLRKNRPGISVEFRVPEGAPSWPTFQLAAGALCLATHWAEEFWLDFDSGNRWTQLRVRASYSIKLREFLAKQLILTLPNNCIDASITLTIFRNKFKRPDILYFFFLDEFQTFECRHAARN